MESRRKFLLKLTTGLGAAIPGVGLISNAFGKESKSNEQNLRHFIAPDKKLGVALVGLGYYSANQLAPALLETNLCRLSAIVTGTPEKVEKWKSKYNIPDKNIYNYQNFDSIKDNPDVDIVYIVLPNAMHAEYAIRAAKAGKHVISEKPMEVSVEKCNEMIKACKDHSRMLAVGYRLHYEPHNLTMMKLGKEKTFGKVQKVIAQHGFSIQNNNAWRLNKKLAGGGPLMDVGIYCIQGVCYTLGEDPIAVTAKFGEKTDDERFKEVEASISWTMEFPSGAKAECVSSYAESMGVLRAEAEKGWFELKPAYYYSGIKGETSQGKMELSNINQQAKQMDDFADCILNKKKSIVPGEMGLRDVKIITAIYEAARTGKKIQIS